MENAHVILHLQHCLEEKAQKIHARASVLTRQVDVLCEAEHAYRDTTLSRWQFSSKNKIVVENAHVILNTFGIA